MREGIIAQFSMKGVDGLSVGAISPNHLDCLWPDIRQIFAHEVGLAKQIKDEGGADDYERQQQQKDLSLQRLDLPLHVGILGR